MNIFHQFIKSLYSTKTIVRFRFQKIGKSILFVFFLSLLSIIPLSFYVANIVKDEVAIATSFIKEQLPSFTIENGTLSSESKEQVLSVTGGIALEFNPTSVNADTQVSTSDQGIALLKDKIFITQNGKDESVPYDVLQGFTITKNDFISFADTFHSMFPIFIGIIFLIMLLFSAFSYFMSTLFLSIAGFILIQNRNMPFKQLFTLSAYSLTIPTVFFFVMDTLQTKVPYSSFIFSFSGLFVLYAILRELPKPKKEK